MGFIFDKFHREPVPYLWKQIDANRRCSQLAKQYSAETVYRHKQNLLEEGFRSN